MVAAVGIDQKHCVIRCFSRHGGRASLFLLARPSISGLPTVVACVVAPDQLRVQRVPVDRMRAELGADITNAPFGREWLIGFT